MSGELRESRLWPLLYNLALVAAVPLAGPFYLARGWWSGKYLPVLRERLGWDISERHGQRPLWLHAVSVGEVMLARTLAARIRQEFALPIVLSSTTLAGLALAREARAKGEVDGVVAAPLDFRGAVRRVFDAIAPRAIILMEAELWPNWLSEAARRNVPVALVNARVSARSARGYGRLGALFRPLLCQLAAVGPRSEADRARLLALGTASERTMVTGDLKFDAEPPADDRRGARRAFALPETGLVVVAGSTHPDESEAVLGIFRELRSAHRELSFVIAPRKDLSAPAGGDVVTRSSKGPVAHGQILWLDTIGELRGLYAAADLAFVGGSLLARGGHNLLEPAACGVPVLFGPHCESFAEVARGLVAAGGGIEVATPRALRDVLAKLLDDSADRARRGAAALALVAGGRGATERTLSLLEPMLRAVAADRDQP